MTQSLLALIFALPLIAQNASVEGRVTNQAGEPLKGTRVALRSSASPQHDILFDTDGDGHFAITGIEPGRYQLRAGRNGYLGSAYPAPLVLTAGQRLTGLTLKMTRAAVLSGKIVDEDGDPVPTARVMLLSEERKPAAVTDTEIRADGSFVIGDLKAGNYFLRVEDRPTPISRTHEVQGPREGYVETYYPGVTDPARATLIRVEAGAEIRDLDFRIVKGTVSRLRGKVVDGAGVPVRNAPVRLISVDLGYNNSAVTSAEGNFEMLRVPPGDYCFSPRRVPNRAMNGSLWARMTSTTSFCMGARRSRSPARSSSKAVLPG